jgi:hypothetical protein
MTYDVFKAIVDEVGPERVLAIYFDNDRTEYYPNGDFNMDDVVDINGKLFVKSHTNINSMGVKGGYKDIPVTVYNAEVQSIITLDNVKDRERIDKHELYIG